ncbi:beta strand repeat-containing protein [Spirosoma koreense]
MKHYYYRLGLLLALWPLVQLALGQGLTLNGLNPVRNERYAPVQSDVTLLFNQGLNNNAATLGGVRVFSAQRGGLLRNSQGGTASVSGSVLNFNPSTNFKPGETVFVTSTTAIQSTSGARLNRGQVHQFTTGVGGTGRGYFTPPAPISNPSVGIGPSSVALGDLDGNGDLDLVTANFNSSTVSVRLNNGTKSFMPPLNEPRVGLNPSSVAVGDLDGDGDLDLLIANYGSNSVSVRLNDGGFANFTNPNINSDLDVGSGPYSIVLGDVDGDGDLDFLTANSNSTNVSVRLNDGSGHFTAPATNPEPGVGDGPSSIVLGDLDGDGDLDLLTANRYSNSVSVRLNNGSGNFTAPTTNPNPGVGSGPVSVAVGDVDGDGDLDLVTANFNSSTVSVRLNNGSGNFTPPALNLEPGVGDSPLSIVLGDVDGDSDLDLVTANYKNDNVSVRLNDGSGKFTAPAINPNPSVKAGPSSVVLGDMDGDGDLDLLTANTQDDNVSLRLNGPFPLTLISLSASPNPVCGGQALTMTASVGNLSGSYSYTLTNGSSTTSGTATSSAFTQSLTASGSGVQSFTLTVSSEERVATATTSVTVTAAPTPSLVSSGSLSCARSSVTLTASGGGTYRFSAGATPLNGGNTATVSTAGVYSVTVTADNGCSAVASTTISNGPPISVSNPATTSLGVGQGVTQAFTASGGASPYSFSVANGSLPPGLSLSSTGQLTGSPTQVGNFTAIIQATDAVGCFGLGAPYVVNVAPFSITGQPPASLSVCVGSPVSVGVSISGTPTAYQWYKDNTLLSGQTSATLSLASASSPDAGSYFVVITGGGVSLTSTAVNLTVRPLLPARLYVNASATGANTGLDWANAFTDLQSALNAGSACGNNLREIWVAGGVYKPTATGNRFVSFQLLSGVALYGGFVGNETALSQRPVVNPNPGPGGASQPSSSTLSGDIGQPGNALDNSQGVVVGRELAPTTVLDGFVITGGRAEASAGVVGGGLSNYANTGSGSPTLTNLLFTNNYSASAGGAILNYGLGDAVSPTISNCRFEQNMSVTGGAITTASSSGNSRPVITNCFFAGNSSTQGGAMASVSLGGTLSLVITNCAFQGNSAPQGGALYQATTQTGIINALITNCSFGSNRAGAGGALYNATSYGGTSGGSIGLTLANSALFDNGGASTLSNSGSVTLAARYSLLETSVTGYTGGGGNRTTASSPFANPTSLLLGAGSPAINAGDNGTYQTAGGPSTDLAGNVRIQQTTIDMGAYENQTPCTPVAFTSPLASGSALCVGGSVQVTTTLSGEPISYQWYKDGALLASQRSATLSLTGLQLSDAGRYALVVTDGCNPATPTSLTSAAFSLTVTAAPTASAFASSTTALVGDVISLSASGGTSYLWTAPPGATLTSPATASTVSATLTSAGLQTFTVTVSQGSCSQTTTVAVTAIQLADLTLVLYARPSTARGNQPITVVVDVFEINGIPTSGPITLKIAKDANLTLSFDGSLSSVGGQPVQNSQWTFGGLSGGYYTLTSSGVLSGTSSSVGLTGTLLGGSSTGVVTVSGIVLGGGEAALDNNTDADKIEYFQQ